MEQIVYAHAQNSPHATAIVDGDLSLTYGELVSESIDVACQLKENLVAPGERIGIFLGPGAKQVIAQLAVRMSGGTCVPIEPGLPSLRAKTMLEDVQAKHVIMDQSNQLAVSHFHPIYVDFPKNNQNGLPDWDFDGVAECSHILFTSGSTGKPKPVQIAAENILHLAKRTPMTPLLSTDRVAEFNNPGFDLSLFEIWVTLISGATIVTIPRPVATDPGALPSFIEKNNLTVIMITASLFEIMAFSNPSMFHGMRHVLTAGDVANVKAVKEVLKQGSPDQLWNTYGPTECTTLTTMLEIIPEAAGGNQISIGRPIGDMEVFLLDEDQKLITEPLVSGEIYIAGPQVALGYLDRPLEDEKRFINMKRKDLGSSSGNEGIRLYRTGDLATWTPGSDCLDFRGRSDNQVKHGGFRVELEEIEKILLSHKAIKATVVVRQPAQSTDGTPALVSFVITTKDTPLDDKSIYAFLRERLPQYMLPNSIRKVSEFPLTANMKVDRNALLQHRELSSETNLPHTNGNKPAKGKEAVLIDLWKNILNLPKVDEDDDFFALGGTSLQAATLIASIQDRLGHLVSMDELYQNSRFQALVSLVGAGSFLSLVNAPDDTSRWIRDVDLVNNIKLVPEWEAADEGRVLLTGVTGFVGIFLLHHLLHKASVQRIACLVRPLDGLSSTDRVIKNLQKYDLWSDTTQHLHKLLVLDGDLMDATLGLGEKGFSWLADWASVIFHLGAKVNFCEAYREHYPANVVGTCNMLRLAATGRRKPFHYMSSVDAWGPTGGILGTKELFEDESLQPHIQGLRYDLGYSQSQWTAEEMVRRMRDSGLPIAIYRPGFIIGHSKTGGSNPNDFFTRFVVGCIQLGKYPQLTQCLEYAPVDYVISAMTHIAASNSNLGRSYHLLPHDPKESVTLTDTLGVIQEAGYPMEMIDYDSWVSLVISTQRDKAPLAPLHPMFQERVLGRLTRWEASQYTPWYRADNTIKSLANRPDIQCHPLDAPMLRRFIAFWERKGFYHV